jgi:hypothetical protein
MADIPEVLIWGLLVAVIVEGFSMALLVYLMFRKQRRIREAPEMESPPPEQKPERQAEEK